MTINRHRARRRRRSSRRRTIAARLFVASAAPLAAASTTIAFATTALAFGSGANDDKARRGGGGGTNRARRRPSFGVAKTSPASLQPLPRYVRIQPRSTRRSDGLRRYDVQTAVVTYEKAAVKEGESPVVVDLHAQVHFGDASYFDSYNGPGGVAAQYDRVHYELVLPDELLHPSSSEGQIDHSNTYNDATTKRRRIRPSPPGERGPIAPSASDARTASQYGLACQVDVVDYGQSNWFHADYTREEFLALIDEQRQGSAAKRQEGQKQQQGQQRSQPLWALASTSTLTALPGAEVIAALFRPVAPSTPLSSSVARRLFSNLFLPGDALAAALRAILWTGVPAPELSVLLLDWSSVVFPPSSTRNGGGGGNNIGGGVQLVSPVAMPVLGGLLTGNFAGARKLVFGQMIVSGQAAAAASEASSNGNGGNDLLVAKRNERALSVLLSSIERDGCQSNALLYGGAHCPGLHRGLVANGFVPRKTEWRTAWSVEMPGFGTSTSSSKPFAASTSPAALAAGLVVFPSYLAVCGLDWVGVVQDVTGSVEHGDVGSGLAAAVLYLVRHVGLYLALSKFVVEWDGSSALDEDVL